MEILSQRQCGVVTARFTLDGSEALEEELARLCEAVRERVESIIPSNKLQALVLGGGYGRGQGGVLKTESGDAPYNDLEFYVFLSGNRLWNERVFEHALRELGDLLSTGTLHVELKVESIERLRRSSVSMFSYDLVSGHRIVSQCRAKRRLFDGCERHLDSRPIPMAEATRLLFNRSTGLLLVKELLRKGDLAAQENDFIGRNLAKAQLALGDVVLTAFGQYHWNCLERRKRLEHLKQVNSLPIVFDIRRHHALGVEFKLHPERISKPKRGLIAQHHEISDLARRVWLWLENRRLGRAFRSESEYAFDAAPKLPDLPRWHNLLLNLRTFGPGVLFNGMKFRYPRERLLNALPLLLWGEDSIKDLKVMRHLQNQLRTTASDWPGLVAGYKAIWPRFS